jgi:hypothetical protein
MKASMRQFFYLAAILLAASLIFPPVISAEKDPSSPSQQRKAKRGTKTGFAGKPASMFPARQWAPPDVDAAVPAVVADPPCALEEVLRAASQRVKELVTNLQQFTATEGLHHRELDTAGNSRGVQTRTFAYMVAISEPRREMLSVEEYRNGETSLYAFPAHLATMGLPALALIFHPYFVEDFQMRCEGLGTWRGQPAWQIYFQQRLDKVSRIRSYRVRNAAFPVNLKGRAWIAADTFQVVRLESDLLQQIQAIPLEREHLAIEYRPVQFQKRQVELWLPDSAELFFLYRGHRYYRRHTFSDYALFSVDVHQRIEDPKISDP